VILIGVAALAFADKVIWVATALALYALIHGAFDIVGATRNSGDVEHRGVVLVDGVIWIAGGIATVFWLAHAFTFGYAIAFWSLGLGIVGVLLAVAGRGRVLHAWLLGLLGICALVFGGWLLHDPGKLLAIGPAVEIAILAFVAGTTLTTFGVQARHLHHSGAAVRRSPGTIAGR
jgi:uncharacterized membrane protein HdeD (DUF308 family)